MFTEIFTEEPGQVLFAMPVPEPLPDSFLETFSTNRTEIEEVAAGLYSVTLDENVADTWLIFVGLVTPADWNEAIGLVKYAPPVNAGPDTLIE